MKPDHQSYAGMLAYCQFYLRERQAALRNCRTAHRSTNPDWREQGPKGIKWAEAQVCEALDTLWYAQEKMREFLK